MAKKILVNHTHRRICVYDALTDMLRQNSFITSPKDVIVNKSNIDDERLLLFNDINENIPILENQKKFNFVTLLNELGAGLSTSSNWDEISKSINSFATNFSAVTNFSYTGSVQTYTIPITGTYLLECVGGGSGSGKGSYISSEITLKKGTKLYIYVGGQHSTFNGGGAASSFSGDNGLRGTTSCGSGATDIRLIQSTDSNGWSGESSLKSRLITAGGGGGYGSSNRYGKYFVIEDYNGYDNAVSKWYNSSDYESASSNASELSNGVLGSGSGSSMSQSHGVNRAYCQYCDTTHETDVYYVSKRLAGGGGYYGGKNGYAGTSYVQSSLTINNITYAQTKKNTIVGYNTNHGSAKITLIG